MRNSFLQMVLGTALIWAIIMGGFKAAEIGGFNLAIVWQAALQGIFFGLLWAAFQKIIPSDPFKHVRIDLDANEHIIKEGGALHMPGKQGQGGKLALTDRRLLFKGSRYDARKFQMSFDLEKIRNIRVVSSLLLLKNEIQFEYTDGMTHRFALDHPKQWVSTFEKQLALQPISSISHAG